VEIDPLREAMTRFLIAVALYLLIALSTIALCFAAAGCMVGPDYQRPDVTMPASWGELKPAAPTVARSNVAADGSSAAWWETFQDPLLVSLVERSVEGNLTLAQAQARVREARAARRIRAAPLWPQLEAAGSYTREHTSKNAPATGGRTFNLYQAGFDASWEIDVFGGNRRAVEAADATVEAAEDDHNAVLVSLMAEVGGDYVSVNLNCLDDIDPSALAIVHWDGRHNNWQAGPRPTPWPISTGASC